MRIPETPPAMQETLSRLDPAGQERVFLMKPPDDYRHWDELKHRTPPEGMTREEWWCGLKIKRLAGMKFLPLAARVKSPFRFSVPDRIVKQLHEIDLGAGGRIGIPEPVANPETRDQYLIRSLMEEAITSSQLEGAVTTREDVFPAPSIGRHPQGHR